MVHTHRFVRVRTDPNYSPSYSVRTHKFWRYADTNDPCRSMRTGWVVPDSKQPNGWSFFSKKPESDKTAYKTGILAQKTDNKSHLVLYDKSETPRFALKYESGSRRVSDSAVDDCLVIRSVQRLRTQYSEVDGLFNEKQSIWNPHLEKEKSKNLQKQLGGVFPSEFLLSEFIYTNRDRINNGLKIIFDFSEDTDKRPNVSNIVNPLLKMFAKPLNYPNQPFEERVFELDLNKPRVRKILEA